MCGKVLFVIFLNLMVANQIREADARGEYVPVCEIMVMASLCRCKM